MERASTSAGNAEKRPSPHRADADAVLSGSAAAQLVVMPSDQEGSHTGIYFFMRSIVRMPVRNCSSRCSSEHLPRAHCLDLREDADYGRLRPVAGSELRAQANYAPTSCHLLDRSGSGTELTVLRAYSQSESSTSASTY